jgi:Helix-turn-helix domain
MSRAPRKPKKTKAAPDQGNAASANPLQPNHTPSAPDSRASRVLKSRSTDTKSQCERALELLKASAQTTYSLRRKGISHPAQRIKDLIRDGHLISSARVRAVDSDGYTHGNVALYSWAPPAQQNLDLKG